MLVKLDDGVPSEWPVNESRVKHENPNISFPRDFNNVDVAAYGFAPFEYADSPAFDQEYQTCEETTPVLREGTYVHTWQVSDKYTSEERTTYDAQKESLRVKILPDTHRYQRDIRISETDWWALSDVTMSSAMTAYRQALRDITAHANWPDLDEADWPTKP